jgi:hypothetical protein
MIPTHPARSACLGFALHNLYGGNEASYQRAHSTPPMFYVHISVKLLLGKGSFHKILIKEELT